MFSVRWKVAETRRNRNNDGLLLSKVRVGSKHGLECASSSGPKVVPNAVAGSVMGVEDY